MYIGQRRRWSDEELNVLRQEFRRLKHLPTFNDIRRVQRLCPSLRSRTLAQIKTRAWYLMKSPDTGESDLCETYYYFLDEVLWSRVSVG